MLELGQWKDLISVESPQQKFLSEIHNNSRNCDAEETENVINTLWRASARRGKNGMRETERSAGESEARRAERRMGDGHEGPFMSEAH